MVSSMTANVKKLSPWVHATIFLALTIQLMDEHKYRFNRNVLHQLLLNFHLLRHNGAILGLQILVTNRGIKFT